MHTKGNITPAQWADDIKLLDHVRNLISSNYLYSISQKQRIQLEKDILELCKASFLDGLDVKTKQNR